MPVTGEFSPSDYCSRYSHQNESAYPGYYQVYLDRYGVNAELTSTLRCAYHKYTFSPGDEKMLLADLTRSNNHVRDRSIQKLDDYTFCGNQNAEGNMFFYAVSNYKIEDIIQEKDSVHEISVVKFADSKGNDPLELKIGFSLVSIDNAKTNLMAEMMDKSFVQVREEANTAWEKLLLNIQVKGGSEREKSLFYSCLYRSFLWPALRSDVNGDYMDVQGKVVNNGFRYYTNPSFGDDYRNKLILLGLIYPDVAVDVIKSITDKGEKSNGYMPTFFHGDHASVFVAGTYLRGIKNFDINRAYKLLLKNATIPGKGGRLYMDEYISQGWIAEKDTTNVPTWDEYKAAVIKTVEAKLDSLFSEPWRNYEAHNMTGFIGNYCHENQPNQSVPYTYYFIDKQEKCQAILDSIMNHYYDMGKDKLAYAGMDDAGEMSSWYVFNAMGLYTYSPVNPKYIVSVPIFEKISFKLGGWKRFYY